MKLKGMVTVVMYVTKKRDRNAIQRSYHAFQVTHKAHDGYKSCTQKLYNFRFSLEEFVEIEML